MARLHFVYTKGPRLKTPERILYELTERLARRYEVITYDMRERGVIAAAPGDILIGHPSRYTGNSLFNRSFDQPGWGKRIVFCPFSHGMPRDAAMIDPLVEAADHYLALCGPYWFDTVGTSLFSHWRYKMMRCDLGLNLAHYRRVKGPFNPPGKRRFLYIGNAGPMKGVDVFCRLAEANPDLDFGWTGWTGGAMRPPGTLRREYDPLERRLRSGSITIHGGADWRDEDFLKTVATYDVLLTCGRSDSNPSTILEATAWGLVPVAPLQCGYYGDDWLTNIPLDDTEGASRILREINEAPDDALEARRQAGFQRLESHYTWDHAARQVIDCIKAPTPMAPDETAWLERKASNQAKLRAIVRRYRREAAVESLFHGLAGRLKREPRPT